MIHVRGEGGINLGESMMMYSYRRCKLHHVDFEQAQTLRHERNEQS